jgi:hypothetical protein
VGFEKSEYETQNHEDLETPASPVSASHTSDAPPTSARADIAQLASQHTTSVQPNRDSQAPVQTKSHVEESSPQNPGWCNP